MKSYRSQCATWEEKKSDREALVFRAQALGADPSVSNFVGGSISCKTDQTDPVTGETRKVLWITAKGTNLASMNKDGLCVVDLDRLVACKDKATEADPRVQIQNLAKMCCIGDNGDRGS